MDEYILRSEILKHKRLMEGFDWDGNFRDVAVLVEDILKIPAADVVPVRHRRWIEKQEKDTFAGYLYSYECSECGRVKQRKEPYCPNCGAKMDLNEG